MAQQPFEVIEEQAGDIIIFNVKGAIDGSTVEQFDKTLGPIFRQRKARAIVDCSALTTSTASASGCSWSITGSRAWAPAAWWCAARTARSPSGSTASASARSSPSSPRAKPPSPRSPPGPDPHHSFVTLTR